MLRQLTRKAASPVLFSPTYRAFHQSSVVFSGRESGAIGEAGGAFSKKGHAQEDQYYRQLQAEQLRKLKGQHKEHIQNHQLEIKRLQALIEKHKEDIDELEECVGDLKK